MRPSCAASKKSAVSEEIETLRQELVRAVNEHDSFVHRNVLHISQRLDKLIYEVQRQRRAFGSDYGK